MRLDQYKAWDAEGNLITADSDMSLKFERRATPIYRERECRDLVPGKGLGWINEFWKVRD